MNQQSDILNYREPRRRRAGWLRALRLWVALSTVSLAVPLTATSQTKHTSAKPAGITAPQKGYGSPSAPITMEVFSDYQCPSCRSLFENTLRPMIDDYVAAGKVYLVHRDFPLPAHKYGYEAARWANAAGGLGRDQFAKVEAALYDNQPSWSNDGNIEKFVEAALSAADLKRVQKLMEGCQASPSASLPGAQVRNVATADQGCAFDVFIEQDRALGQRIPVQATPTYVFSYKGQRLPPGSGLVSWPILKQFFDSLLGH